MRGVPNILNYWRHLTASKLLVTGLFALAVTVSGGALLYQQQAARAASCSNNDIIRCGVSSPEDFEQKVSQNESGDLPEVYAHYGIDADEVTTQAVEGTAYRDGTIEVDGRVVATDVTSLGRSEKSYSSPVTIDGKTYHESASQDVFLEDSLEVLVVMDSNNQFEYAIIKGCGNPAEGNPTSAPEPKPKPKPEPKPQVEEPIYECTSLDAIRLDETDDDSQRTYQFEANYQADNGASLEYADFDFNNGEAEENVIPEDVDAGSVASQEVTYTEAGEYSVQATLVFDVNGELQTVSDEACEITIDIPQPEEVTVCNPETGEIITVPETDASQYDDEDSLDCQPCPYNEDIPESSSECIAPDETPPEVPSTGAAQVVGGALGVGSLAGAGYYFRISRRNLFDSVFNIK